MYETRPCPNPRCVDGIDYGYAPAISGEAPPAAARCCHTCDGRGEVAVLAHLNRRHYYGVLSVAEHLDRDAKKRAQQSEWPAMMRRDLVIR